MCARRVVPALLLVCVLVTSCAPEPTLSVTSVPGDPEPEATVDAAPQPTLGPARGADSDVIDASEIAPPRGLELPIEPVDFGGLVTPAGVSVAVLGRVEGGLLVRTPCGRAATLPEPAGTPLRRVDVVLDPGHGGPVDTGSVGANGLVERAVNLVVAELTRTLLEEAGFTVALTRTADYASTLGARAALADALDADVLVSIHHNAPLLEPSEEPGTEIFVQSGSDASRRLGGLVYAEVVDALDRFGPLAWNAAPDAGVLAVVNDEGSDAYGMIRRPETVTVLAELAYLANAPEAELIATDDYQRAAASAVARAVQTYLAEPGAEGRGFQPPRTFNPERAPGQDVCVDPPLS